MSPTVSSVNCARSPSIFTAFCLELNGDWLKISENKVEKCPLVKLGRIRASGIANGDLFSICLQSTKKTLTDGSIAVYDGLTGESVRQHNGLTELSDWIQGYGGHLFVSTLHQVFMIDAARGRLVNVVDVGPHYPLEDFVIVDHNRTRISIVVKDFLRLGLCRLDFVDGIFNGYQSLGSNSPYDMKLVGASGDTVYFAKTNNYNYDSSTYTVIQNNQTIREGTLDMSASDIQYHRGKLYAVGKTSSVSLKDPPDVRVLCVDLSTGETILDQLVGSSYKPKLIPMVNSIFTSV